MYQNQANNLNRITAYYGYPAPNINSKQLDDSNNVSLYSTRKAGDDTLNKSQQSPKSPNTSELLIQNIGGKVSDLSKEVSRLMQINDKLLSDISILNAQNQNKDHIIKSLQENLNNAERKIQSSSQQINQCNYNNNQNNNTSRNNEKEEPFQQSASKLNKVVINNNILQPRLGVGPFSNINNIMNQNQTQNTQNNINMNEDQQRFLLNSLQVNSEQGDTAAHFLFNSHLSQSGKNTTKNGNSHQNTSNEKPNGYNQIPTNLTSPWSINPQEDKSHNNYINSVQPFNNDQHSSNQQNKVYMLASFQDKQSSSSDQVKELQYQLQQYSEELEQIKKEKAQLQINYDDLKQKYEQQNKEHAREIAQLKTNMFNSVVESDNYSKEDEDDFAMHGMKHSLDKNANELVKSIEVDEKMLEGRFKRKDYDQNFFNNNSFSASKDQQLLQKSNQSNNNGIPESQTNLIISQEIVSKSLERNNLVNSQQQILAHSQEDKNDQKGISQQFIKRNSVRQGTINSINTYKDNVHFLEIVEQLEIAKKENLNLKHEMKIVKDEILFISGKDNQAHNKNEQLRIIAAKLKLESDEEIMKFKIKNEELQSEIKKQSSLNKNLQNEILRLKEGLNSHQRSSTIFDEKTLENLFDSEIESDQEDLEDDGYGDRDSKQIRKHKNDILNTMTHNEKIYNNIIYLKRKNRRLEDQLQEWKRQYWLLEKSTQNHSNNHHQPTLQQQNSQNSNPDKNQFEFNFSQYLQYQQKASLESKKVATITQIASAPLETNENMKLQKLSSSSSSLQRNELPSQCDTPAIGFSMNNGRADNNTQAINRTSPSEEIGQINKNNLHPHYQDQLRYDQIQQQQAKNNQILDSIPKSAQTINNKNNNDNNYSHDQFYLKQASFSNYNPYNLNSNYQILKYDQYSAQPVTQFSPSEKLSSSYQNLAQRNTEFNPNHIAQIQQEKKILEKGVKTAIKDIKDQVNQLQKRKIKNSPQSLSQQQQLLSQQTKQMNKQNQLSSSQKLPNDQLLSNRASGHQNEYQKQHQSTSGMHLLNSKDNNSKQQQNSYSTSKISCLINNFKKLNLDKPGSPKNKNLNQTSTSSNNNSLNMIGNLTCQTDRQILYTTSTQPSAQSQSPIGHQNNYQQYQQKKIQKTAQTTSTTPKLLNAKHTTSVHQSAPNHQQQQQQLQQIKQVLYSQPTQQTQEKNTFNNRESANLSCETSKSQITINNNIGKSTSPINSKQYPKQIEQSYSSNFVYQKTKFNQRIKDKYN